MVGTEKTITCANGEDVVCNAGTYDCIDNSPTLCGNDDAKQQPEDPEAGTYGKQNADADAATDKEKTEITHVESATSRSSRHLRATPDCLDLHHRDLLLL